MFREVVIITRFGTGDSKQAEYMGDGELTREEIKDFRIDAQVWFAGNDFSDKQYGKGWVHWSKYEPPITEG